MSLKLIQFQLGGGGLDKLRPSLLRSEDQTGQVQHHHQGEQDPGETIYTEKHYAWALGTVRFLKPFIS